MIQKFQCGVCSEVADEQSETESCLAIHAMRGDADFEEPSLRVITLDLWECDGESCQKTFDSQAYAEQCEAEHETADAEGKPGVVAGKGVSEWLKNFAMGGRS
jgi:hypothetical protein